MQKKMLVLYLLLAPAAAFADSESHREATVELMEVMRLDETINQVLVQFEAGFTGMASDMDLTPEQRQMADRQVQETMAVMQEIMNWSTMEPYIVEAYMNVFTEEEIREIIVFYGSPTGQKMLDRTPQLMEESMRVTRQMMQDVMPRIEELQEELRSELDQL